MGSKADGVNLAEIRENALGSLGGGQPRSIRKRGYHRALKRGEPWAVCEQAYKEMINGLWADMYRDLVREPNPFLGLSAWIPNTNSENFFSTDRTIRLRYPSKPSLWSRIKKLFV